MEVFYVLLGLAIVIIALVVLVVICSICSYKIKLQNGNKKLEVKTSKNDSKPSNHE